MEEIQVLWVHESRIAPGTMVKNHSHDYFHLIDVIAGQMAFCLENTPMVLEAGDALLVRRGCIHRFSNETKQDVCFREIKFNLSGQNLPRLLETVEGGVIRDAFARELIGHVALEYSRNRLLKEEAARAALQALVLYLTAQVRQRDWQEPGLIDTTGYNKLSRRVIAYLSDHYGENLSLDDISVGVGVTKNYLCNAFKNNTDMTIVDCLNMIRIRMAAEQIVYSDLPLSQVAQMCGYVSVSHFNRVFMRYVGMPPGQCRRAYAYDVTGEDTLAPGSFIGSVLTGRPITPEIIRELALRKD